jgi:hypothetical protein
MLKDFRIKREREGDLKREREKRKKRERHGDLKREREREGEKIEKRKIYGKQT